MVEKLELLSLLRVIVLPEFFLFLPFYLSMNYYGEYSINSFCLTHLLAFLVFYSICLGRFICELYRSFGYFVLDLGKQYHGHSRLSFMTTLYSMQTLLRVKIKIIKNDNKQLSERATTYN